ncbi:MAG: methylenetetrahydrofolate--tRNA-(uracil(54)-C(5))-methyltransferase (FADH(2)-oxidizing) TrmFO [Candidatus Cloacimonetes bacterium]|nr:methylenetetrahydrofolate--tRNA-(uracil(54)-C(5))-methyltransferase (FADH(2)-oxidizing) TrmFO [Candidatus Cloacimonadota bacterium]
MQINIIGAGLAGSEAALQFADAGWQVMLYEMRPHKMTPAHETGEFAELVCSNSFKSLLPSTASGLLKAEMELLGCKLLPLAQECAVPAGNALAIDRSAFAELVTQTISEHTNIHIMREEVFELPDDLTLVTTGPLTSDKLVQALLPHLGEQQLYFFDAIAPIVAADSLDYNVVYRKTRYDKGEADYLNCPFTKDEYYRFVEALNAAEKHEAHEFENEFFHNTKFNFYENCTPVEELARRGKDTLSFGVMRPVGLEKPSGERPFAVLQLRTENSNWSAYNLVGCQTMLRYPEQKRIFQLIPGLENAEFLRYGSIHRNTYLNAPETLNENLSLKDKPHIFFGGQITGVEGYTESIFGGLLAYHIIAGGLKSLPETTISGQLWRHLITPVKNFQPMNANFGILPPLEKNIREKQKKKLAYTERSLATMRQHVAKQK